MRLINILNLDLNLYLFSSFAHSIFHSKTQLIAAKPSEWINCADVHFRGLKREPLPMKMHVSLENYSSKVGRHNRHIGNFYIETNVILTNASKCSSIDYVFSSFVFSRFVYLLRSTKFHSTATSRQYRLNKGHRKKTLRAQMETEHLNERYCTWTLPKQQTLKIKYI